MEQNKIEVSDEEYVRQAHAGERKAEEYLVRKYKYLVRHKARAYYIMGADREDIIQEGMIGLFKAIRNYQPDRMAAFKSFAEMCVKRQMITAVKSATCQKHLPLNTYVSLNKPVFDGESDRTMLDMTGDMSAHNPEQMVIKQEEMTFFEMRMQSVLSSLEIDVLELYLEGLSYQEIADKMGKHIKSVDNALQRIKRKLDRTELESLDRAISS